MSDQAEVEAAVREGIDQIKPAPTGAARDDAFHRLTARIDETSKKAAGVPEDQIVAAIDEAVEYVRHHRE